MADVVVMRRARNLLIRPGLYLALKRLEAEKIQEGVWVIRDTLLTAQGVLAELAPKCAPTDDLIAAQLAEDHGVPVLCGLEGEAH